VNETGLKLTYNSGNQKLLAVKGSERFSANHREKGKTMTIVVCVQMEVIRFSQWFYLRESTEVFEFK
jgi:hypothetical protein